MKELLEELNEGTMLFSKAGDLLYVNKRAEEILAKEPGLLDKALFFVKEKSEAADERYDPKGGARRSYDLRLRNLSENRLLLLRDRTSEQKLVEMGREFIGNASHEMRTPLTIIKGFAETLRDMPELPTSMFNEIMDKIIKNCQRMELLVKNLLLLTDLDYSSSLTRRPCDLVALVEQCIETLLLVHPDITLECLSSEESIMANIDVGLFEIVLMNLLQNGVKYSMQPAELTVIIEALPYAVRLSVRDRGMGIPEEDIPHLFERFYTVSKTHSRKMGGAGLGLAIIARILEHHGATINVISKVNEGSTFEITIPT